MVSSRLRGAYAPRVSRSVPSPNALSYAYARVSATWRLRHAIANLFEIVYHRDHRDHGAFSSFRISDHKSDIKHQTCEIRPPVQKQGRPVPNWCLGQPSGRAERLNELRRRNHLSRGLDAIRDSRIASPGWLSEHSLIMFGIRGSQRVRFHEDSERGGSGIISLKARRR